MFFLDSRFLLYEYRHELSEELPHDIHALLACLHIIEGVPHGQKDRLHSSLFYLFTLLLFQRVPSLRFDFKLVAISCYELFAKLRLSDMTDELYALDILDFIMVADRHGEQ